MDCESCEHNRRLKHNFKVGEGYQVGRCCIALSEDPDGFVLEVKENGYCEMYSSVEEK